MKTALRAISLSLLMAFLLEGCKKNTNSTSSSPLVDSQSTNTSDACSNSDGGEVDLMLELASTKKTVDARTLKITSLDAQGSAFNAGLRTLGINMDTNFVQGKEADYYLVQVCDEAGQCTSRMRYPASYAGVCLTSKMGSTLTAKAWACLDPEHRLAGTTAHACNTVTSTRVLVKPISGSSTDRAAQLCAAIAKEQAAASALAYKVQEHARDYMSKTSSLKLTNGSQNQRDKYIRTVATSMVNSADQYAKVFSDASTIGELYQMGTGGTTSSEQTTAEGLALTATCNSSSEDNSEEISELEQEAAALEAALDAKQEELDAAYITANEELDALQAKIDAAEIDATSKDDEITELNDSLTAVNIEKDLLNEQLTTNQVSGGADSRLIILANGVDQDDPDLFKTQYVLPYDMRNLPISQKTTYLNTAATGVSDSKKCFTQTDDRLTVAKCSFDTIGEDFPISLKSQIMAIRLTGDGFGHFKIRTNGRCLGVDATSKALRIQDCDPAAISQNFTFDYTDPETKKAEIKVMVDNNAMCLNDNTSEISLVDCSGTKTLFYISNILTSRTSEDEGDVLPDSLAWLYGSDGEDHLKAAGFYMMVVGGAVAVVATTYTLTTFFGESKKKVLPTLTAVAKGTTTEYIEELTTGKLWKTSQGTIHSIGEGANIKYVLVNKNSFVTNYVNGSVEAGFTKGAEYGKIEATGATKGLTAKRTFGVVGLIAGVLGAATGAAFYTTRQLSSDDEDDLALAASAESSFQTNLGKVMEELRQHHLTLLSYRTELQREACAAANNSGDLCQALLKQK